jgi:acyl carrier protein
MVAPIEPFRRRLSVEDGKPLECREQSMAASEDHFKLLVSLIRDVKPSLGSTPIKLEDSLVENLGLDSLDIMQLARKIRRNVGPTFDPQVWAANHLIHKYAIKSLVDAMGGAVADSGPNVTEREVQRDVAV